jgi:hypothetical protein
VGDGITKTPSGIPLGLALSKTDTDGVLKLIDVIAAELERSREITGQVFKHIAGTYGVERDDIPAFLMQEMPKLEDYELDLILSPLFTPKLPDQAVVAKFLGTEPIPREDWPVFTRQLANRPTIAQLVASDRKSYPVPLREISIERFVYRLRLDGTIPDSLQQHIRHAPASDLPILQAIARRATWEHDGRREILERFLQSSLADGTYKLANATELLRIAEDYQPADSSALLSRIPAWQRVLEEEIHSAGPKVYFSSAVQQLHGGNDNRLKDEARMVQKQNELAFLKHLQQVLTTSHPGTGQ